MKLADNGDLCPNTRRKRQYDEKIATEMTFLCLNQDKRQEKAYTNLIPVIKFDTRRTAQYSAVLQTQCLVKYCNNINANYVNNKLVSTQLYVIKRLQFQNTNQLLEI